MAAITMVAAVQNLNADSYIARVRVSTAIKDGTFYCVVTTSPSPPVDADIVNDAITLNNEGVKAVTSSTDDPLNVRVATTVNPAWYAHCTFRVTGSTYLSLPISSAAFSVVGMYTGAAHAVLRLSLTAGGTRGLRCGQTTSRLSLRFTPPTSGVRNTRRHKWN